MPCTLAISSMSLGQAAAGHSLADKLDMAQKYHYRGIEIFYGDLVDLARKRESPSEPSQADQLAAAREIRDMCRSRGLDIISLQPFMHYEGLTDRAEHERRLDKLAFWIRLVHALGTDLILIPSNFLPPDEAAGDEGLIVSDLREAADMGLRQSPPVRFAYEGLCWGTRVSTWEQSWAAVERVDRPNFGLCLDTFNIAGRIFADPESPTGKVVGADEAVRRSMARLVADVDVAKVFFVQVVDAARLREPLVEGHAFYNRDLPARMSWSRNCRLFYGEKDRRAYLPVREIASAIFHGLGFRGWVSLELFNRRMEERDGGVPEELARRGWVSWMRLARDMREGEGTSEGIPEGISASL